MPSKRKTDTLTEWFAREPGITLAQKESQAIQEAINAVPGVRFLQIGTLGEQSVVPDNRQVELCVMSPSDALSPQTSVSGHTDALPFKSESMDIVYLLHAFEYASHPHALLHEAERVLAADGYLVITGFNPVSLWGLVRLIRQFPSRTPWSAHFFSCGRIKDWMTLLGLELCSQRYLFFGPPIKHRHWMRHFTWAEKFAHCCLSKTGAAWVIMGRKRTLPLSLIPQRQPKQRKILQDAIPTSRQSMRTKSDNSCIE
jgi:SAM-dependent methyltransferase